MRGDEEEKINHLFFKCKIAWLMWSICYYWLGMLSVNHYNVKTHLSLFKMPMKSKSVNRVYMGDSNRGKIWKHRNNCIFKSGKVDHVEVFTLAQLKVWACITSKEHLADFSYSEWCMDQCCMSCLKSK